MKIGILTLPLHYNYGGILQAYALLTFLRSKGYDAYLLEQKILQSLPLKNKIKIRLTHCISKLLPSREKEDKSLIYKNVNRFISLYLSNKIAFSSKFELRQNQFDAFVVGSDQIWRGKGFYPVYDAYMAYIHKWNTKRIAYSASFGIDELLYTNEEMDIATQELKEFHSVSVREKSGISLCQKLGRKDVALTLDPTMLLEASHYLHIAQGVDRTNNGGIYYYFLNGNKDKQNALKKVSALLHKDVYTVFNSKIKDKSLPPEDRIIPSIEEWINGFVNADVVVTDSFHGTVFSILFHKPFIVYGSKIGGLTRFETLLEYFNLSYRYIESSESVVSSIFETSIDWDNVDVRLEELRSASTSFLLNSL